jgi:hypothetical protein
MIIGGANATCVLAARLSENNRGRGMVEAGRDIPPDGMSDDIGDGFLLGLICWRCNGAIRRAWRRRGAGTRGAGRPQPATTL